MSREQILLLLVTIIPLALVFANRVRLDVAALGMSALLGIAQLAGWSIFAPAHKPDAAVNAIAGFRQPVVLTLFSLFVLSGALQKSGVARWLATHIVAWGGKSERMLILLFSSASALLSTVMSNLAVTALMLPSAIDASRTTGVKTGKLLIPIAFGSLLGGVATYFTAANVIVSDLLVSANPPQKPLHILDFTLTGGLIALVGIVFLVAFGPRLLPDRDPSPEVSLVRRTSSELAQHYQLDDHLWELRITADSVLAGRTLADSGIAREFGLAIVAIWRGRHSIFDPAADYQLLPNDLLVAVGREDRIRRIPGVEVGRNRDSQDPKGVVLVEAMIAPQSHLEGLTLREARFRENSGFTAVAVLQQRQSYRTDVAAIKLHAGNSLLLVGNPDRLSSLRKWAGLIVFEPDPRDLPIQRGIALTSAGILTAAVIASIAGVPVFLATLAGAVCLFLTGLFPVEEAYESMPWQVLIFVAGMYPVSQAMVHTGLAAMVSESVLGWVAPFHGIGLLAGAWMLTALLTQVIGGQVVPLVAGPIMIAAAIRLHVNPQAVAVATAMGCSAAFLTPFAHPVNLLVIGPGDYRFKDFLRIGLPLLLLSFVTFIAGMLLFWNV